MTVLLGVQDTNSQLAGPTEATMRPERKLSDLFWMFTYKVELCPKKDFHDWEKCAYAHLGERARRRHPSKYQAVQCPEARAKKVCPRGMECPCTHHLFEYWLHPDRYLTCLCELGQACNRPICFFAHTEDELRPLPPGLSVAAQPPAPASHKAQQNKIGSPTSSHSTPIHSLVPDLVASFNQALAMQELRSSSASPAAGVGHVNGTGSDGSAPAEPGSGVQLLIEQMASAETSPRSTAFSALDDLAADKASKHPAAVRNKSPTPLAIVVSSPSASSLQRTSSDLASGSPAVSINTPPAAVGVGAGHVYPLQQLAQQQQPGRVVTWHGGYPAAASAGSSGTVPIVPTSPQALQVNLQANLHQLQQQKILQYSSGASISCSSPLALAQSSAMNITLGPMRGSISPVSGVSPRSITSGMQGLYVFQQQQQQARGMMGVMDAAASVGQSSLGTGLLGQQQQQYVQVPQGGAGYAVISMPAVVQPQMLPRQVYEDPAEHLSFSLWGGDAVAVCQPTAQNHLLHQSSNLGVQQCQQQLQVLQQRQQLLQLLQQQQDLDRQSLERQYQLQQIQQVATAVSAPVLGGGVMGSMQPGLGVGMGVGVQPTLGEQFVNQGVQPTSLITGIAPVNTGLMIGHGVSNVGSSGFEGFQALNLSAQQQQQQVLQMPQLHQPFGTN